MRNKFTCKNCKRNYKSLTKEGLCATCSKEKHGTWSKRWTDVGSKHTDGEN